jgi:hypothetical protein
MKANTLGWAGWQATLAFVGLAWLYQLGQFLWLRLPWLRPTRGAWWVAGLYPSQRPRWGDPARAGAWLHMISGLVVAVGTVLLSLGASGAFDIQQPQTLAISVALLALAGMLALLARRWRSAVAWAFCGLALDLAVTWLVRWLGADVVQAVAVALTLLALLAYLAAVLAARPAVLVLALTLGVVALATEGIAQGWVGWQTTLAFVGLAWLYQLGRFLWGWLLWLRSPAVPPAQTPQQRWSDPVQAGERVHLVGGLIVAVGTTLLPLSAPGVFGVQQPQTLATSVALLALAGMLALLARRPQFHVLWYLCGLLASIAVTWLIRWLGAENVQAFVVAPGSYLLIVGTFLPGDARVPYPLRLGQAATLSGSLLLLLPTLYQTYSPVPNITYQVVLFGEALVIMVLGIGTRWRYLILTGSAFVGVAALSAVNLALQKGVSLGVVFGVAALVLILAATGLSIWRSRRVAASGPRP